jgi:hypothetical protein
MQKRSARRLQNSELMTPFKRCILILADGARPDLFQQLLKAGKLPAIQEHLVDRGGEASGITVFPSTTGPAYMPFLSGCYPGTCNVPGIRWFNKEIYATKKISRKRFRSYVGFESYLMGHDMTPELRTLFHLIPSSVNIFSSINRGSSFKGNRTKFWRIWYWYYAHLTDRWMMVDHAARKKMIKAVHGGAEFIFTVFPGIDEFAHVADPFHEETVKAYQYVDKTIDEAVRILKERGEYEETMIMIVSDHGLSSTHTHFGLANFLEATGRKTFYYPKIFKRNFTAASMVSGNGMAHVYFKGPRGWKDRLCYSELMEVAGDAVQGLLKEEGVDILACQADNGGVHVMSRRGQAIMQKNNGQVYYKVTGQDPFGYKDMPSKMTDREALQKTYNTNYPDAIGQLLQIYDSPRTGDLVISARRGFDLRKRFETPEHKASHGSLDKEHMAIPIITNIPLPDRPLRSVDVFPTILQALGREVPTGIDGESFLK